MCVRRWDTRDPHGIVAKSPLAYAGGKDYSRGTNFTCMATSGDGYVAVGSKVRLILILCGHICAVKRIRVHVGTSHGCSSDAI